MTVFEVCGMKCGGVWDVFVSSYLLHGGGGGGDGVFTHLYGVGV